MYVFWYTILSCLTLFEVHVFLSLLSTASDQDDRNNNDNNNSNRTSFSHKIIMFKANSIWGCVQMKSNHLGF